MTIDEAIALCDREGDDYNEGRGMNAETIISIEEFIDDGWSGFLIVTDRQQIKLSIENDQWCCEEWGYFMSEDSVGEFIGAELRELKVVNELLEPAEIIHDVYEGSTMFVNIETSTGTLQFVAYNEHNGYYGHTARIESAQLNHEEQL